MLFVKVLFQQHYGTSGEQLSFMTSKYRSKFAEPNPAVKRRMCAVQTPDCTEMNFSPLLYIVGKGPYLDLGG